MTETVQKTVSRKDFDAVIFDLDGVITRTATVHARAWKQMFDDYLELRRRRGENPGGPFDIEHDYGIYIDGKPRYDGVRSFLQSRGIELPEGTSDDPPDRETVCGLGNHKNEMFHELVAEGGVEVFEDTVEQIHRWQKAGFKMAVVSSSRNCAAILEAAGLGGLFKTRVDGLRAEELGLAGKPAPDIFLKAAQELEIDPVRGVVFEDAVSGVQAGRAGHFGLVIGVARKGDDQALLGSGAHLVVRDLRELKTE